MHRGTIAYLFLAVGTVLGLWYTHQQADHIKQARFDSIVLACEQQNERHDDTISKLDELIAGLSGARQRHAIQSRASTVLLINALVPKYDCVQRARKLTNP